MKFDLSGWDSFGVLGMALQYDSDSKELTTCLFVDYHWTDKVSVSEMRTCVEQIMEKWDEAEKLVGAMK